jgi:hypothetical protein
VKRVSINPAGAVTGPYLELSTLVWHSYVRAPDGTITTFDAPGAGTGQFQGTFAYNINPAGAIAGQYLDANNVYHGYVRAPDGAITTFDAPDAGTGAFQGTLTATIGGLNAQGRSGEAVWMQTTCIMASCAPPTAPSPPSTFQARAPAPSRGRSRVASTRRGRFREPTLTQAV